MMDIDYSQSRRVADEIRRLKGELHEALARLRQAESELRGVRSKLGPLERRSFVAISASVGRRRPDGHYTFTIETAMITDPRDTETNTRAYNQLNAAVRLKNEKEARLDALASVRDGIDASLRRSADQCSEAAE